MYKLIINDKIFTIPKQNLKLLAITKAIDLKANICLDTEKDVIKFLNSIGVVVKED